MPYTFATPEDIEQAIEEIELTPGPQGEQGEPGTNGIDGTNGTDGEDGEDGASAYEIAVANGFVGDEAAWLLSLKGANGTDGAQGIQGIPGPAASVNLTTIPAGSTITVYHNGTTWPSRPTARTDITVHWISGSAAAAPSGALVNKDLWIKDAV